jgi:uncharacterized protein
VQNELITIGLRLAVIAVFGLFGATLFRRSFRPSWFIGALILYVVYDALLTRGFGVLPNYPPDSAWNWTGKFFSFAGMALAAGLPFFGWRKVGLTLRQAPGSRSAWIVFAVLAAVLFLLAWMNGDGSSDLETIAFQWTMPGLAEELFYCGVFLVAMNEAFTARARILGAPISYGGLLTSLLFGLAHALSYGEGGPNFDVAAFAMTALPSLIRLWLREKTGSLVLPVLAHNVKNGAFTLF